MSKLHIARAGDRRIKPVVDKLTCGLLIRGGSLWVGAHYSSAERRWCINFLPCITFYIVLPGGNLPRQKIKKWE